MATSGGHMDFMLGGARVVSFWIRYCKTLIQHWCNIWYCKVFFLYKLTLLQPDNGVVGRCQSVCPGGVRHVTITHDALHFTAQAPLLTWDHHWRPVQTCPFHLTVQDPLRPPQVLTSGSHWSTYGWTVRILLDCFLFHRLYLQFFKKKLADSNVVVSENSEK